MGGALPPERRERGQAPIDPPPQGRDLVEDHAGASRIKGRRGPKKAIMAVAASILTAAYHMLKHGVEYSDLGPDHFDRLEGDKRLRRLVRKIEDLGYAVELKAAA
jgi:hypothetical protein